MRTTTHTHLSVVEGFTRFARVTVVESEAEANCHTLDTILILNDRPINERSEAHDKLVQAAIEAVRDTESRLGWRGSPLRVAKVESSYVDMHPEAARLAAISAATELIGG